MHSLEKYYRKTLKYELANKFFYKNPSDLPKLEKIILNFGCRTADSKSLISSLLALKLISSQKGILTSSSKSNLNLKIRKGNPVGCKVTLRRQRMFSFFSKGINNLFPVLKNFEGFVLKKNFKNKDFSFYISDILSFSELRSYYHYFNSLTNLKVTFVVSSLDKKETKVFIKALQLPYKN